MFQGFRIWDFRDSKIPGGFCESLPQFFDQINVCFCVCKKARVFLFFVCLRIFFFFSFFFVSLSVCLVFCVGEQNLLGFGWDFGSIFIVLVFFNS